MATSNADTIIDGVIRSSDGGFYVKETKKDSECPPNAPCFHQKPLDEYVRKCKHSHRFHCNPCICCCCFGGYCNLRKNGILIATIEIVGGLFLAITAVALTFHILGLMERMDRNYGAAHEDFKRAYMQWKFVALSAATVGFCGICGGLCLLYSTFSRSIVGCYTNIAIELIAISAGWAGVIFVYMGLSTVWKLYQNTMNRQDTLELYDDQLYVLLGAVLVATSMTLVLSYFIACAGGLALQMRAGVENNPFYCTYFGSTVYMTNCTRCYEEAKPKSPCCPLWNSNAQSRKVAPVPREVEFVSAAPSTELIEFPPATITTVPEEDEERRGSGPGTEERKLSDVLEEEPKLEQRRRSSDEQRRPRKPPTGRKFEWPESCSVCDFKRLPRYNRNSI